jgi:hypothetical protein
LLLLSAIMRRDEHGLRNDADTPAGI